MSAQSHTSDSPGRTARKAFWRKILTDLGIMTVIGVFLAVIGPFGSISQAFATRLPVWLLFSYLGYAIYSPLGYFVERGHTALDLPKAPLWFFACLVATVPMTLMIYVVQFLPRWPTIASFEEFLTSYFYVFVIGGAITLLFNVLDQGAVAGAVARETESAPMVAVSDAPLESKAEPAPEMALQSAPNPLLDALPAELGSDVIALEMEDHYVRVHTALGSELVLMRLRDAMVHVTEIEGRQTHRSWWVARGAVEDVLREGRNVRLVLARGVEAPVSRAQVSELKDAGWI